MATENKTLSFLSKNVKGILFSLCVQFILGMAINLYGVAPDDPKFAQESPLIKIAFITHGINGLILPIGAVIVLVLAFKSGNTQFKKMAALGLISILISAGG